MIRFIDAATLQQLVNTHGLHTGRVLNRLHYNYCRPMAAMGKCARNCSDCQTSLDKIFAQFINAKDKYALITWRSRDQLAAQQENQHEGEPVVDRLGHPQIDNRYCAARNKWRLDYAATTL